MPRRRQDSFAHLWAEMVEALFGRPTVDWIDGGGPEYLRYEMAGLAAGLSTSGDSDNLRAMACSIRYFRTGDGLDDWRAWFKASWKLWMGSEVDSTIYDSGHVCAVLLVAEAASMRADLDLYEEAMDWLEYYLARAAARWSPRARRVLAIGQRSAGHNAPTFCADDFLRVAKGWDPPAGWKKDGRDKAFMWACKDLLRAAWAPLADVLPVAYLLASPRQTKTGLHVFATARGMAIWHDPANIDAATQPVPGAVEIDGEVQYFPPNRADGHDRSRAPGTCTIIRTANSLVYTSAVYGRHELPLPPGEAIIDVVVGRGPSVEIEPPAPTSPPADPPPATRKENKWTGWL